MQLAVITDALDNVFEPCHAMLLQISKREIRREAADGLL
jgi:hypothetical protein